MGQSSGDGRPWVRRCLALGLAMAVVWAFVQLLPGATHRASSSLRLFNSKTVESSALDYPQGPYTVGVEPRAITINGQRRLLIAGCIHYPRSTPAMWPALMQQSKAAGINVIETYVFWNHHEPRQRGDWDFSTDNRNLPLFLELAKEHGLFVNLRLGPYVCGEWQYGGFPEWLRHVPGIHFRTWNEPFQREMARFVHKVVDLAADYMPEKGGPIIMMQMENEYGNYEWMYGEDGHRFAQWCGEFAHSLNSTVPWIMCRQFTKVPYIIPTHNDFYCHQYLPKFFSDYPKFPGMWTENWPGWFQRWGEARPTRPVEDIAYAVARWFAAGGSYHAYYMWHGGTNFGRSTGPMIMTSYDYDVMLDEYGLARYPKYHHLQRLHQVLLQYQDALVDHPVPQPIALGDSGQEAYVYGDLSHEGSLAFLVNADEHKSVSVVFEGESLVVPRWSVMIMAGGGPQGLQWLYTSSDINPSYPASRLEFTALPGLTPDAPPAYTMDPVIISYPEPIPPSRQACPTQNAQPLDQLALTNDTTDYTWYVTDITVTQADLPLGPLVLTDVYDVVAVYVDGQFVAMERGSSQVAITLPEKVFASPGGSSVHTLQLLVITMGWTNGEKHMEAYRRGLLGTVHLGDRDLTHSTWGHLVGLAGEVHQSMAHEVLEPIVPKVLPGHAWSLPSAMPAIAQRALTWHRLTFTLDASLDLASLPPLALDLASMTKGFAVLNGHHLGRYWLIAGETPDTPRCQSCDYAGWFNPDEKCRVDCGKPSQRYYHVPQDWLSPPGQPNILWLLEEVRGEPHRVQLVARTTVAESRVPSPPLPARSLLGPVMVTVAMFAVLTLGAYAALRHLFRTPKPHQLTE
ncbi:Beta-galactosidase-1-like protein [Dimargaris xerosporica]|nr:Beta-galactosidase-1-like protein [Dimargaris xerosporica]